MRYLILIIMLILPAAFSQDSTPIFRSQLTDSTESNLVTIDSDGELHSFSRQSMRIDSNNSTNVALLDSAVFTGVCTERKDPIILMSPASDRSFIWRIEYYVSEADCLAGNTDSTLSYSFDPAEINIPRRLVNARQWYRVFVTNNSGGNMTFLRFQSSVGDAGPLASRLNSTLALDADADLVRAVIAGQDPDGEYENVRSTRFQALNTALSDPETGAESIVTQTNSLKVAQNNVLSGQAFGNNQIDIDATNGSWIETVANGGTQTVASGELILDTNGLADASIIIESFAVGQFLPANFNTVHFGYQINDTGAVNNIRRWGAFDDNDGVFLELNGLDVRACTRKNTVDTCVEDQDFNGSVAPIVDGTVHVFEAFWNAGKIEIRVDNTVVHNFIANGTPLFAKYDLPVRMENFNVSGGTADVQIQFRAAGIYRNGEPTQQPTYTFIDNGSKQIKLGAGHLHRLIITRIATIGGSQQVEIYDNTACDTSGNGRIIMIVATSSSDFSEIDFGVNFRNGLCILLTSDQYNVTAVWN